MKAVQMHAYGGPEVLQLEEIPQPTPQKGQILVEVTAASINPFDYKLRSGVHKERIPLTFPVTFGSDFSGKVVELGEEVTDISVGDSVFGGAIVLGNGSGSLAEFATVKIDSFAKAPMSISLLDSAALPLVGSSAVQALEEHIQLQKGQRILIHGGAGGIGSIAIQLAKHLGAYVSTTVSTKDIDFVKGLGADDVVDYTTQHFEEKLKDFDAVYDTVGAETTTKSFAVLKKGGILVSMLGKPDETLSQKYGITSIGQQTKTNTSHLSRVATLVDSGAIKPLLDKVFPLAQVQDAFTYQETQHPQGKVVIQIR